MNYLKAKKLKMDQLFEDDRVIPVTLVEVVSPLETELKVGDFLKVSGISKSKGFQGVVKRHGFHGGPKTHGQKDRHRAPGSIGATAAQRVLPGRRMAGRTGGEKVTLKNLKLMAIDEAKGILTIKGATPGRNGSPLKLYLVKVTK